MRLAHITLSDGEVIHCVIRDLSVSGAKLAVARRYALPEHFDLNISGSDLPFPMRRVWRRGDFAGVMLVCGSATPRELPKPDASPLTTEVTAE
ncbi:PilZ domain-containing protein [Methylobacterium sp. HMF5984]|uniref:PilZ domain-containing protein n=1 Tax=Methylobacterium sp. HMF5984 TaxID=3367370 RepID=UPI003852EC98